jgi:hypothetical protein
LSTLIFTRGGYENVIKNPQKSVAKAPWQDKDEARAEPCTSFYVYTEMDNEC